MTEPSLRVAIAGNSLVSLEHGLTRANDAPVSPFLGISDARELVLRNGFRLIASGGHRVLTAGEGGFAPRPLSDIEPTDYVAFQLGREVWAGALPCFDDFTPTRSYGNQKRVSVCWPTR